MKPIQLNYKGQLDVLPVISKRHCCSSWLVGAMGETVQCFMLNTHITSLQNVDCFLLHPPVIQPRHPFLPPTPVTQAPTGQSPWHILTSHSRYRAGEPVKRKVFMKANTCVSNTPSVLREPSKWLMRDSSRGHLHIQGSISGLNEKNATNSDKMDY